MSDLNGTLIYRKVGKTAYHKRPRLETFLADVFANHTMMIWTSARPHNAATILQMLLDPTKRSNLVAAWARDTLSLTPEQYEGKVQVYKRLERIWRDKFLQATYPGVLGGHWGPANTLLMDDSVEKARAQPFNLVNVPELQRDGLDAEDAAEFPVLMQVKGYLDEARWWSDVSAFVRLRPFAVGQGWECGGTLSSPTMRGALKLESAEQVKIRPASPSPSRSVSSAGSAGQRQLQSRSGSRSGTRTWRPPVAEGPAWKDFGRSGWRQSGVKVEKKKTAAEPWQQPLKAPANNNGAEDEDRDGGEQNGDGFTVRRMWTRDFTQDRGRGR